ncbi:hypothetical protein EfmJHP35_30890 (plasmid) [Enterococcus faecium]|nr:hypothetical protein EfmJHP35_30890 [Enterococcus faecium]
MYWQKRLDRKNPDQEIEAEMLKVREKHKDYGCLRMTNELRNRGFSINKKKVQRLIKKLGIKVTTYTRKSRRYNSYRGMKQSRSSSQKSDPSSFLHQYLPSENHDGYN